jgi:chromosome segregation ATPase
VTVNFDDDVPRSKSGKPLSDKKLNQLSQAREKALLKRRQLLKFKLEAKLSELRQILGPDLRPDIERVAHMLLKQEETLRSKQNALVLEVKDVITDFKADLQAIKEKLSKPSHSLSSLQHSKPRPRPVSEASSTGSGRTITIAT